MRATFKVAPVGSLLHHWIPTGSVMRKREKTMVVLSTTRNNNQMFRLEQFVPISKSIVREDRQINHLAHTVHVLNTTFKIFMKLFPTSISVLHVGGSSNRESDISNNVTEYDRLTVHYFRSFTNQSRLLFGDTHVLTCTWTCKHEESIVS